MRKIGINISSDISFGVCNFIDCIAETGFDCIFTCGNDDKFISYVSGLCYQKNLTYETLHAPFDGINDLWDEDKGRALTDRLIHSVELAHENGIGIVISHLSSKENCPPVTDAGLRYFDELVNLLFCLTASFGEENFGTLDGRSFDFLVTIKMVSISNYRFQMIKNSL